MRSWELRGLSCFLATRHYLLYPIWKKSISPTCIAVVRWYSCKSFLTQQLMQRWACQCVKGCQIRTKMTIMKIQQKHHSNNIPNTNIHQHPKRTVLTEPLTSSAQAELFIAVVNIRPMQGGGTPCRGWETLRLTRAACGTFSLTLSLLHVGHAWMCGGFPLVREIHENGQPAVEILYEWQHETSWTHLTNAWALPLLRPSHPIWCLLLLMARTWQVTPL